MEEKEILNIVITGGPCAGKTTALEELAKFLEGEGYTVLFANETATELIKDGIKPFGKEKNKLKLIDFQRLILYAQIYKEKIRRRAAKEVPNKKVAILYDRGILDNRAYITDEEFQMLMDEAGITEEEILKGYDLVIHLVSTAVDKVECYKQTKERTETPEQAKALDNNTRRTWRKHKHHVIIYNDCSFTEKIGRVIGAIKEYIDEKKQTKDKPKVYQK